MTVNVTSVNQAPTGTSNTVTTLENTAYTFAAADFGFSDPNDSPPNNLLAVKITTLPAAGTLTDNGVAVTAGQFVAVADINGGKLKFTPAANASGAVYASFTFQVQDDGGTANGGVDLDPSPKTMTVNVTWVNQAPTGANKTVTTLENTAYTFATADFGFSDPNDSPPNNLLAVKITTLPAAGTLDRQRRGGHGRPVRRRGRHQRRQARLHAGGQCQRRSVRQLHLPGAGRRRHGQRRRRYSTLAQDDDRQCHLGQSMRRPARTRRVTTLENTAYTFARGRLWLQRPQ